MEQNRDAIRLNSVRRIDPHVLQIQDSANRTALYSYDQGESWSKTDVEGTLMVYSRVAPPHHMVTIINRLNKSNFIEPLSPACDTQVKPPYLLFRNSKGIIYGIWFSDAEDVERIAGAIQEHLKANEPPSVLQPAPNIMADPAVASVAEAPVGDIMSMLSRAHGEFKSKRQEPRSIINTATSVGNDLVKPAPLRVQAGQEQNTVADFFAKVSGVQAGGSMALGNTGLHSPSSNAVPVSTPNSSSGTNPVLQQLFQGAAAVGGQAMVQQPVGPTNPIPIPGSGPPSHPSSLSSSVPPAAPISLQELEGRMKDNLKLSSQVKEDENIQICAAQQKTQLQPFTQQPMMHSEPSLLSPQVFTTTSRTEPVLTGTPPVEVIGPGNLPGLLVSTGVMAVGVGIPPGMDGRAINGSQESLPDGMIPGGSQQITPLTQEQLVQAFTLLLKKDDFVRQLHEAYVQALNLSLKGFL